MQLNNNKRCSTGKMKTIPDTEREPRGLRLCLSCSTGDELKKISGRGGGTCWIFNASKTKWLPSVTTHASRAKRREVAQIVSVHRTPETVPPPQQDPLMLCSSQDRWWCVCVLRVDLRGLSVPSPLVASEREHLSQINKALVTHYCTRRLETPEKPVRGPERHEQANIKKGWPYYKEERLLYFSWHVDREKGDNGGAICFIYSFCWCLFIIQ